MCAVVLSIIIVSSWMVLSLEAIQTYRLDNTKICHSTAVITKWLEDDDVIFIFGKRDAESLFTQCEMVFGPGTKATQLSTMIQFQNYANNDCGVYLLLEQSPYQFFDKDVTTVVNLTCLNKPGAAKYFTDAGKNLRIKLHKSRRDLLNYNFVFNITLTDHETATQVSSIVIIVMGVIIAIIIPLIGCIVYKVLKIKRWSKQHYTSNADISPHANQPLRSFDGHSTPPSVRYSSMPLGDQDTNDSIHSQTCIVGTQGTDGRCTVCHRSHENFAHVVDVDSQGVIVCGAPNCSLYHRNHEDFVHFEEVNPNTIPPSTENQRLISRVNPPIHNTAAGARGLNRQFITRNSSPSNGRRVSVDDDDIDVSGNDLIPPSYDLCPPSYDEAIDMPTPSDRAHNIVPDPEPECDPLYQNIDDVLTSNA